MLDNKPVCSGPLMEGLRGGKEAAMKCRACSAVNPADAVFCTNCGASLSGSAPKVFCARCRTQLEPGAAFCTNCGLPAVQQTASQPRCPKCGMPHSPNDLFCDRCGVLLASLLEPPAL